MIKKLFLSLLCGILVLGLATGCGNNQTNNNDNNNNNSDDISNENSTSYKVKVNNSTFTFPCKFEEFQKAGYSIKDADIQKILSSTQDHEYVNAYSTSDRYQYDLFGLYIKPNGNNIKDATVFGIYMNQIQEVNGVDFSIEDLEIGKATIEDVENKLGKPYDSSPKTYSKDDFMVLFIYDLVENNKTELTMHFTNGVLDQVYLIY